MTRKEFINKLQLCYFGEKKAFNEIVKYFDTLQKHYRTAEKLQRELEETIKEAVDYIKGTYEMAIYTKTVGLEEDNIQDLLEILERTDKDER